MPPAFCKYKSSNKDSTLAQLGFTVLVFTSTSSTYRSLAVLATLARFRARSLPVCMVLHWMTLAFTAPHLNHTALEFTDPSGWGSDIAVLVAILGPLSIFVGGDVS